MKISDIKYHFGWIDKIFILFISFSIVIRLFSGQYGIAFTNMFILVMYLGICILFGAINRLEKENKELRRQVNGKKES